MQIRKQIRVNMDILYGKSDPLYVSLLDKIVGITAVTGALVVVGFSIFVKIDAGLKLLLLFSFISFVLSAVNALFPQIPWTIEKIRLSFIIRESKDVTPFLLYFVLRKVLMYLTFAVAVMALIYVMDSSWNM